MHFCETIADDLTLRVIIKLLNIRSKIIIPNGRIDPLVAMPENTCYRFFAKPQIQACGNSMVFNLLSVEHIGARFRLQFGWAYPRLKQIASSLWGLLAR